MRTPAYTVGPNPEGGWLAPLPEEAHVRIGSLFVSIAFVALALPLAGCFFVPNNGEGSGAGDHGGHGANGTGGGDAGGGSSAGGSSDGGAALTGPYDQVLAELNQHRTKFRNAGASEMAGIGTHLFWLEFPGYAPTVHSFDTSNNAEVDYGFSIGSDEYNFRASEDLVVTAEVTAAGLTYHAYSVDQPKTEAGSFNMGPPSDGVEWWAYAPDHSDVYVVTEGAQTKLLKWTVGMSQPAEVLTFEKIGIQVGEFEDFGVGQGKLIMVESGRIWSVDLATQKPTWLGNKTEASGADWGTDGVLYESATGPFFYDYTSKMSVDVGKAIASSGYQLDKQYPDADRYDLIETPSVGLLGQHVVYTAAAGVFTIDLSNGQVRPVLLNALDNSVVYQYPVVLDDGSIFVQGLQSSDGATGADGPLYYVSFKF